MLKKDTKDKHIQMHIGSHVLYILIYVCVFPIVGLSEETTRRREKKRMAWSE
jgi:hypothetical protein